MMRLFLNLLWGAVVASACGCGLSCGGGVPAPVVPSLDLAVCVFDQYSLAPACRPGGTFSQCIATIANACGADAAAVERVLTAEKKARLADGFVVKP
jgi:hypothetical protein